VADKNATATLPADLSAIYLKPGEERLNFTFNDLDGKPVSINDARFKNKVVVVQLMGSWCPNCMDETAFLSEYYRANKQRGVEIVALAYEYSTDTERSIKSLRKFQQRFNVQYPMLLTGVSSSDSLRTEKTLPQVTTIRFLPSSIILDKNGKVRKFDTGFNGPGTGEHYVQFKKEFETTIDGLLKEH
jgi:peroxiredoxin